MLKSSLTLLSLLIFCHSLALSMYLNVKDFGATANDVSDDHTAIQAAIDSAALTGSTVFFPAGNYKVSQSLTVPAGVSLIGEGRGMTSTGTPSLGTIITNTGSSVTIRITGTNVSIESLVIYDDQNAGAAGGIEVIGDGTIVESVVLNKLLISGFTDGTALKLKALNAGGVTYCSFYDIRVRYGKVGILIDEASGSFINSNSFYHGAISGDGFDYGIHIIGGNNNVFNALVLEPYSSNYGHFVVEKGEVKGNDIRIEGSNQPDTIPLIFFTQNTRNSVLSGIYSGGLTVDNGDNAINLRSGKSYNLNRGSNNLFENNTLRGGNAGDIPFWQISGASAVQESNEIYKTGFKVIEFTINAGSSGYLRPDPLYLPSLEASSEYGQVNFGAFVKTNIDHFVTTTAKAPSGLVTGGYHPGDNQWHSLGMTALVDTAASYDPKFYFHNQTTTTQKFYITIPSLSFGYDLPTQERYLTTEGGVVNGTLSYGKTNNYAFSGNFLTLKKDGNVFDISETIAITRVNHLTADRIPAGTVVILLLQSGTTVVSSGYIQLNGSYTAGSNGSISLVSMGDGTWREVCRVK